MDPKYRKILQKNIVTFRRDMLKVVEVVEYLWSQDILSESMKDDILSDANRTEGDKASALHTLMPKRGKRAFEEYYKALRLSQNHDLADILEPHIAIEQRVVRESGTVGGATGGYHGQETPITQPQQTEQDEPDLPANWPDVDENPMVVQVKKCHPGDEAMKKRFNNDTEVYAMKGKASGVLVLIINNKTFLEKAQDTQKNLDDRIGTDIDATSLDLLFKELGYKSVDTKFDLSGEEIIKCLNDQAQKCKRTDNAFICVILSHGTIGSVYGVDGVPVRLQKLYDQFNAKKCPNLAGKPKMFFIQACQGGKKDGAPEAMETDSYVDLNKQLEDLTIDDNKTDSSVDVPIMSDILVATATTEGYVSYRNSLTGTWFIQALIYVIKNYAHKVDLLSILTKTNALLTKRATRLGYKQCAEKRDTFNKAFYFFPGFEDSDVFFK